MLKISLYFFLDIFNTFSKFFINLFFSAAERNVNTVFTAVSAFFPFYDPSASLLII